MQIPPQEDWSPELLSELQRAVPVLESSSFELQQLGPDGGGFENEGDDASGLGLWGAPRAARGANGQDVAGGARAPLPRREAGGGALDGLLAHGGQRVGLGDWASEGLRASSSQGTNHGGSRADPLAEDAMALPMTTLTSGKRRTYPNKSTFQAHVCCVMDPLQVPRVLEALKSGPQFASVRSWPYAYRIISPFDGKTREDHDDDEDPGAGEKMLGLLKRMGLENLLLIVSRWDTGPTDRLGVELFRCVNEQCKELLRELQQAVRASFPPDELLGSGGKSSRREAGDDHAGFHSFLASGTEFGGELELYYEEAADSSAVTDDSMVSDGWWSEWTPGACALDLVDLGPAPPGDLVSAARGLCPPPPLRRRRRPPEDPNLLAILPPAAEAELPGLEGRRLGLRGRREPRSPQATGARAAEPPEPEPTGRRYSCASSMVSEGGQSGFFLTEPPPPGPRRTVSHEPPPPGPFRVVGAGGARREPGDSSDPRWMSDEEVLRLKAGLRSERLAIEEELARLGRASPPPRAKSRTSPRPRESEPRPWRKSKSPTRPARGGNGGGDGGGAAAISARAATGGLPPASPRPLPPSSARVPRILASADAG